MTYRLAGWLHGTAVSAWERARDQRGQGTVEYVGMTVMVALLVGGVAVAAKAWDVPIGNALRDAVKNAIKALTGNLST